MGSIDISKVYHLIQEQEDELRLHTAQSKEAYQRAKQHLVGGVGTGYHSRVPYPLYIKEGKGSKIIDVDGNMYPIIIYNNYFILYLFIYYYLIVFDVRNILLF